MEHRHLPGSHIAKRLLADKRIDALQLEMACSHAERNQESLLDALIDCNVISEAELLKYVANMFKTQFVSTQKLSRASVPRTTLGRIPLRVAEKLGAFPIVYEARSDALSIVTANTDDPDLGREIQLAAQVKNVRVFIARPAAVYAAIQKHYYGEPYAFARIQDRVTDGSPADGASDFGGKTYSDNVFDELSSPGRSSPQSDHVVARPSREVTIEVPRIALPRIELPKSAPQRPGPRSEQSSAPLNTLPKQQTQGSIDQPGYIETLNVLVSLLERSRQGLRGHSAKLCELCTRLARRLGMTEPQTNALRIAALIHDLGKSYDAHLAALYVAEQPAYQRSARTSYKGPIELLASAQLPEETIQAVEHLYERFDGAGFPGRLVGEQIPLNARILSLLESYTELVGNPNNEYERMLSASEALDILRDSVGAIFDPKLFEAFQAVALGDGLRSTLRPPKARVLLIDPNLDQIAALELRFIENGYSVEVASDAPEALKLLASQEFGLVICEVQLASMSGFELLNQVKQGGKALAWIFLTTQADRQSVSKGFECGASDYLIKPTAVDVIVTKAQQIMESHQQDSNSAGMAGSLKQMGIPEIVQVFAHGRKSGKLRVDSGGKSGEVHFSAGDILDARYGELSGEQAFYAMLNLSDGQFFVDPSFVATNRVIHASAESLLLEGMRLLDEAGRT
jgi:response regulator RpfG family c-di-GMP phosphodiesterase